MTMEVRRYLDSKGFLEVETPMLVGSILKELVILLFLHV